MEEFIMKRWLSLILAAALAVCVFAACSKDDNTSGSAGKHHVEIEVQDYGTIAVELDGDAAPITVENFLKLANEDFYDGLTFHRIIDGFMIQGGDPEGTGMGGSDETIKGEFSANGVENNLSHTRGAISMARNSVSMDSASSQFFIVQSDSTYLDGQYACFGYVTSGMDIVDQICKDAQPTDGNGTIPAAEQPVITAASSTDGQTARSGGEALRRPGAGARARLQARRRGLPGRRPLCCHLGARASGHAGRPGRL
jgi:peptidyl-prolyl cis-trans isomerase B (cyclophilin B)